MELMEWNDSLCIGIKSLDEQHMMLIDIVNDLDKTLQDDGDIDEIINAFDAAKIYILKHFKYEEDLLKRHNYPGIQAHILEHQKISKALDNLHQNMLAGDIMVGSELLTLLTDWANHHLLQEIEAFSAFFKVKDVQ